MVSPRERMVVSAALLIRERGAHPTAIADVLEHSGAPRGSAYHYFPGGRTQLLCEAIDYAGEYIASKISTAGSGLEALDGLVADYRKQLLRTDFRAGCPVVAVTVEAGDPDKPDAAAPVIERAAAAFARWNDEIAARLHGRRRVQEACRRTRDADDHIDRGGDRRRARLPRCQASRSRPWPAARPAAGRSVGKP